MTNIFSMNDNTEALVVGAGDVLSAAIDGCADEGGAIGCCGCLPRFACMVSSIICLTFVDDKLRLLAPTTDALDIDESVDVDDASWTRSLKELLADELADLNMSDSVFPFC